MALLPKIQTSAINHHIKQLEIICKKYCEKLEFVCDISYSTSRNNIPMEMLDVFSDLVFFRKQILDALAPLQHYFPNAFPTHHCVTFIYNEVFQK